MATRPPPCPALRKLMVSDPNFIVGPFSLTIMSVSNQFGPDHTVDYVIGGTTLVDHMQYPYVFRTRMSEPAHQMAGAADLLPIRPSA